MILIKFNLWFFFACIDTIDIEFSKAFESLTAKEKESLDVIDNPPPLGAIFCRNLFKQLSF